MRLFIIIFLFSGHVMAGMGSEVLIKGKVSGTFDNKQVKIIDSFGQTYFLPRTVFPENVPIKEGENFSIEVEESVLKAAKIKKKK